MSTTDDSVASTAYAADIPPDIGPAGGQVDPAEALASVHTTNFPDLLRHFSSSLAVSTYQAGKLVLLRPDGGSINTHFRTFHRPMGMAADGERLALGTFMEISEFRNMPALAPRLHDPPRHDAVFLARRTHITGNIDIHEMAWDGEGELWFVNTLFSCLCTLDSKSSFVPRWRPSFVSHYAPEDRCHLNGLGMREGRPRYVTALGDANTPGGWRTNKRDGGLLIDLDGEKVLCRGLSMPHSPRWYQERLWVLESGRGALVEVDPRTGERRDVARVPGFARGMDFLGPLAFIGLSQLRASNPFTDIPITDDNSERLSGIWAVNIENGRTVAFLKFTGGVEEIFAVEALRGARYPELVTEREYLQNSYALPDEALKEVQFSNAPAAIPDAYGG